MEWTTAQVEQMAPDAESLAAARKLHRNRFWQRLGLSPEAVWGECLGSSVYQVVAEVSSGGYHCTCPSRKYPCKHVLGLLWILAIEPSVFAEAVQPEWVSSWLAKRKLAQAQKEAKALQPSKTVNPQARVKNAEQRLQRVLAGLEQFDIWLCDQVRDGLATWETQGKKPWEEQARRLVDAQAPGLAARLRQLGEIPGTSPDWPERLLGELGRIYLAIRAFRRLSELNPGLAMDLRQWMGWIIKAEDLQQAAAKVDDNWMFLGQWVEEQ
ncbi:MAG TPA: SWIM zinc finger domain-containing protein, partial [Gemmatales bacterium]|nr:SWIM zinc finger domain-containing protein [Gemmatales bacterium]